MEEISSGRWKPGGLIPSEVALAADLGVHRLTVNRVLADLARDGHLVRRRGIGTVLVAKPKMLPDTGRKLIGLVTGHAFDPVTNPFYGVIFDCLRKALKMHGIFMVPLGDAEEFLAHESGPMGTPQNLSAIAMLGIPDCDATLGRIEQCGHPAVIIAVSEYCGPLPHIATEDNADAALVAKKILALGHRRIVHINAAPPKRIRARRDGFLQACDHAGYGLPFNHILEARGLEMRDGHDAMLEFLKLGLPFTAVFGATDNLALGAMSALSDHGISVPGQVSVVGFDGIEAALHSSPRLATMRVSRKRLAEAAADVLESICAGHPVPARHKPLHSKWIEGASLASPPYSPDAPGQARRQSRGQWRVFPPPAAQT
jgi:DNA-binding LacI/PurR family transcriptional regulator